MFCHQYPTRASTAGNGGVRSLWDNEAPSLGMVAKSREAAATVSINMVGS